MNARPHRMQVTVGYDYVLVVEWLDQDDRRTGTELHTRLRDAGVPTRLVVCDSGEEVRMALANALREIGAEGIPAIQLETHGTDPFEGDARDIGFGAGRGPLIRWSELGEWLAPLNEASGYRLLVVSAACWGSAVIGAIGGGEHNAPFAGAIGFRTDVPDSRLFDAMVELYRALRAGESLEQSIASAQRELGPDQQLQLETAVLLAAKMLWRVFNDPQRAFRDADLDPQQRMQIARQAWNRWFPARLQEEQRVYRFENVPLDR